MGWLSANPNFPGVELRGAATGAHLAAIEDSILSPLPADLRLILRRHNGARLPSGLLLSTDGDPASSIPGVLKELATRMGLPVNDPEVLLPFFRSDDGGILAFDRTAGPVADTWPIVDYDSESQELRLVYRTFDGWCRLCVAEWTAPDFSEPFTLDKYLRAGERHVRIEPDVSVAHATVAHALRRAGEPERALRAYLSAAHCVPALPWSDWEALKLGVLLGDPQAVLDAAGRLCSRAPSARWHARETTPASVADVLGHATTLVRPKEALLQLFDHLHDQAEDDDSRAHIAAIRRAVFEGATPPPTRPLRSLQIALSQDPDKALASVKQAYLEGSVRDDDLLLEPAFLPLLARHQGGEIIRQPRPF